MLQYLREYRQLQEFSFAFHYNTKASGFYNGLLQMSLNLYNGLTMKKASSSKLNQFISDRFSPEWKLLSETEAFVSHTPDFPEYEQQFKEWRAKLQRRTKTDTDLVTIRSEIVTLRKILRLKGYDLSLGLQRLVLQGFRNDDSMADGFRRVVICLCDTETYFQTGSANHIAIGDELMDTLTQKKLLVHPEFHFLWFLRFNKGLILSGSATEPASSFERLEKRAQANPMKLLSALRNLS